MSVNLADCFERIYIISLDGRQEGYERTLSQLNQQGVYGKKIRKFRAVQGDMAGVPAWWQSGGGAWGCLLSHCQIIQEAAMDKLENYLVLEDDAVCSPHFQEQLDAAWAELPKEWDQMYLGGQHLLEPVLINEHWNTPLDINRTHAFALKKEAYQRVHAHLMHAPDYISAYRDGWYPHCDHQLGRAHRRQDWKTVALNTWLFGQGENWSHINCRWHPDKWWDWQRGDCYRFLPYVIIENDNRFSKIRGKYWRGSPSTRPGFGRRGEVASFLHFGWELGPDKLSTKAAWALRDEPAKIHDVIGQVAKEAFDCRRLPGFYGNQDQVDFLRMSWPGGTVTLRELEEAGGIHENLENMVDYPWNGLLDMRTRAIKVSSAS